MNGVKEYLNNRLLGVVLRRHPRKVSHTVALTNDFLIGRKILNADSKREYLIEMVNKQWWWGWYVSLLLEADGEHEILIWDSGSSADGFIISSAKGNREKWILV